MKISFEKNDLSMVALQKKGFRGFPVMFHTHVEILCVINGEIKVNADGHMRNLKDGEMCVVFPYVLHSYEDAPDTEFRLIMFSPEFVSGFDKTLFSQRPVNPFFQMNDTFELLTKKVVAQAKCNDGLGDKIAQAYLSALVGEIITATNTIYAENARDTIMQRLLIYCNEHFSENITVSSAAAACFISESYVSKIFATRFQQSFRTYINELRINEAKVLLKKSDLKISEIMYACGFKNQSSFNRIFIDFCGKSPREYRKDIL